MYFIFVILTKMFVSGHNVSLIFFDAIAKSDPLYMISSLKQSLWSVAVLLGLVLINHYYMSTSSAVDFENNLPQPKIVPFQLKAEKNVLFVHHYQSLFNALTRLTFATWVTV